MSDNHENKTPFERRLAGYALACGAAVLGANQADAGVHYSGPLNQSYGPIPVAGTSDPTNTVEVDFNGDSNLDFIAVNGFDDNEDPFDGDADIVRGLVGASAGIVFDNVLGDGFAANLSAGTLISGASDFGKTTQKLSIDSVPTPSIGAAAPWNAGASGYVGVSFFTNGGADINFGWVELEIGSGYEVILKGYAYEDVPLTAIVTGAIPEPSSLALLACGAAGVFALNAARKRRVAKSA